MSLSTPVDRHYKFGELFGIRGVYDKMHTSIELSRMEESFFNKMMAHIIESGNMEKIERFALKNRTLSNFAKDRAIEEAYNNANLSKNALNIPNIIKKKAKAKLKMVVSDKALSIKTNSYNLPNFIEITEQPTIIESLEDYAENEKENEKSIDELIKNIAVDKGYIKDKTDIIQSEDDKRFEDGDENFQEEIKHNYSIQTVEIESIAGNDKKTEIIPPTYIFQSTTGNEKVYLNSTIKNVTDGINALCGINFTEDDYIWLASGRPTPHLRGEITVSTSLVKGNRLVNSYFGPAGEYKDYLYKPDGSPRIEPSKAEHMNEEDRDINAIQSYPIIKIYATIISWDVINGKDVLREITDSDFYHTNIKYVK